MPIQSEPYDVGYYDQHLRGSLRSAKTILGQLFEHYRPASILDVGCGIGTWLRAASELGIADLQGIDGDHVEKSSLLIDERFFRPTDLRDPFELDRRFELTVSVEVAEHLPYDRGPSFVRDVVATTDIILFSAAAPYQGGRGHFNEQWPEYWAILFRSYGFDCFDPFRDSVWDNEGVEPWYAQNAFLFIKQGHPLQEKFERHRSGRRPLSRIHPQIYLINITRHRPIAGHVLDAELSDWQRVADAFISGATKVPALAAVTNFQTDKSPSDTFPWTRLTYSSSIETDEQHRKEIESLREANAAIPDGYLSNRLVTAISELSTASGAKINSLVDSLVERENKRAQLEQSLEAKEARFETEKKEWHARQNLLRKAIRGQAHFALRDRFLAFLPGPLRRFTDSWRVRQDIRDIKASGLFDSVWYLQRYPDVGAVGLDPIKHYVVHGAWEGRWPNPSFDTTQYLAHHEQLVTSNENPYAHFLRTASDGPPVVETQNGVAVTVPALDGDVARLEPLGVFNTGWYGRRKLAPSEYFRELARPSTQQAEVAQRRYDEKTQLICDLYYGATPVQEQPAIIRFGPVEEIRAEMESREPRDDVASSRDQPTYSIVTAYYSHREYFFRCAASVAALIAKDFAATGVRRIEWIVVDDDPSMSGDALVAILPEEIRPYVRVVWMAADGVNRGVAAPLNEAIRLAKNDWILFLDNDDMIAAETGEVLDHYIRKFRRCRYMASGMVDIAEDDTIIRLRRHDNGPSSILESGMIAGHLKAIRRDLFDELGLLKLRYAGVQDYEFALRVSIREPILLIPEYLYYYRWHKKSISVRRIEWQNRTAEAVRSAFIREFVEKRWPKKETAPASRPVRNGSAICLVRTQGKRMELLLEAIESLLNQPTPVTPCIIVHADRSAYMVVKRWLTQYADRIVLLFAEDANRMRGYPLNVGIDYAIKNADRFEYLFILDDDDIVYPLFSERARDAFAMTDCDVVYLQGNKRDRDAHLLLDIWPLPTASLLFGNFIPINCFAVRIESLIASGARFREDMNYLEDWDFLISLLSSGLRFHFIQEALSEFRIIGDGNTEVRRFPEHFADCRKRGIARSSMAAGQMGLGAFYRDLLDFDFSQRPRLNENDFYHLAQAHQMFKEADARQAS